MLIVVGNGVGFFVSLIGCAYALFVFVRRRTGHRRFVLPASIVIVGLVTPTALLFILRAAVEAHILGLD